MRCSFSRLLYPKSLEEARSGSFTIALFYPREKVVDAHGNEFSSIKVVGYYLPTVEGLKVDMSGHWKKDTKYGLQFEMESYEEIIAPGKKGIISYLTSRLIQGVGPKLAERIYSAFGEDTLQVLDNEPDRLLDIPGISTKKCEKIRDSYLETRGARKLITLLAPLDISARRASRLSAGAGGRCRSAPLRWPGRGAQRAYACGRIPVVKLDRVFRQDEGSLIAENAKLIRHNIVLDAKENLGEDFQFWPSADFTQSAMLLEKFYVEEVNSYGVDNVALLIPFRKKTDTGVRAMNERLRAIINPPAPDKAGLLAGQRLYRVGDKVIQIKNAEDVSNGDVGYIWKITMTDGDFCVEVDFGENRIVDYEDYERLNQLELAYVCTIHKSQGSEYTSVLISVQSGHGRMLKRPLIYTAITRAKRRVQLVGDWEALISAIQTADTERRNTMLALRLQQAA